MCIIIQLLGISRETVIESQDESLKCNLQITSNTAKFSSDIHLLMRLQLLK